MEPPPARCVEITVLGIGNVLLGDEGVGIHALKALAGSSEDLSAVQFLDGGTLSFSLAAEIEECQGLIVFDAAEMSVPAGEIHVFEGTAMDCFLGGNRKRSVHEVGLIDLMAIAALEERLPVRRALIAIQPAMIAWSDTPSTEVAASIPAACACALELVERWRQ